MVLALMAFRTAALGRLLRTAEPVAVAAGVTLVAACAITQEAKSLLRKNSR